MIVPSAPLASVGFLVPKEVISLATAGLHRAGNLLDWLPRRYEDRRRFDAFPAQAGGPAVCLRGTVVDSMKRAFGPRRKFYEAVVMDGTGGVFGSGKVTCRWFNMPFIHKMVAAGQEVIVYGKPKDSGGKLVIDHPEFEVIRLDGGPSIHLERMVPIYRNVSGIAQRRLREIVHELLGAMDPLALAPAFDVDPSYPRHEAYREVHFPEAVEQAEAARRRFALEEFFALQLNVVWRRARNHEHTGRVLGTKTSLLKRFYETLPFDLTGAQKRSIKEIVADMREPRPMNRLLQGDVGSGKTFVAMASMLLAIDSGVQAALMAPTQILAEQHFLTFRKWLEPLGVRVMLKTAAKEEGTHLPLEGTPQVLIGTHALLYDKVAFQDLGLVVIDEQHKFGVTQRSRLIAQGITPDVLVMTATPIPRTLTMTIYGDLDVSILDERPAGRGKMVTALRTTAKQTEITKFVKDQLDAGRQAYLVYPLVEESETLKAESATEAFEKWQKRLPAFKVGMVHGKLDPEQKEDVMRRFRDNETQALVATTVIEVGVDVPNANLMIIHHAERFGLAQLHQLRGRIGRGEHKSYCILLTDGKSAEGMEKLAVMEKTSDGFVIAEEDLRLRGPGDVLGTMQSGLGDIRFADFLADTALLREARALADQVIREDAMLSDTHAALRGLIHEKPSTVDQRG
ncbi:ATP-dependent DNA helicase RecG [Luteolibacter sp. GHJ8]|uniref:ATP-dependent DNA helicase RecG n=1 Tax=Luteolibacter rhizosphaerae TaxID=2989719 RepID=A0ABT3G0T9_9BACT|nr:ATP-dependent DNA helicase RecG [Luteolibacter rhizosphaerae]MCW1913443.1 ATP-dependent DNA helicase RecG [Luteolibacter rhizosphaerae]